MLKTKVPYRSNSSKPTPTRPTFTSPSHSKKVPQHSTAKRSLFSPVKYQRYRGERKTASEMFDLFPVSPILPVPANIVRPSYALTESDGGQPHVPRQRIVTYNDADLAIMRSAGAIASHIRAFAGKLVRPGITTDEIDQQTHAEIIRLGAYPSPLGYHGFPKSLCTSVNNVVCHGIPDARVLQKGDIINCDITIYIDGFHSDCSATFAVGEVDATAQRLMDATKESMEKAIAICHHGQSLQQIGRVVQEIADRENFGVVPDFCGHGIGREFHLPPQIIHAQNNIRGEMYKGMVFTIEPIMNETPYSDIVKHTDNWTMLTVDGARSAQYEETVFIHDDHAEVLTKHKPGYFDLKH